MQLYDGSADREAEAKPPLFRRKKRLKDLLLLRRMAIPYHNQLCGLQFPPHSSLLFLLNMSRRVGATPSIASIAFMKRLRRICCSWIGSPFAAANRPACHHCQLKFGDRSVRYAVAEASNAISSFISTASYLISPFFSRPRKPMNHLSGATIFSDDVIENVADFLQILVAP